MPNSECGPVKSAPHRTGRGWRSAEFKTYEKKDLPGETFLKVALAFPQRVIVKLDAQRKVLYGRIGKKRRREQGGEWTFSSDYPDKFEFVRKLYKEFKKVPSDITIDTTRLEPQKVFQIALKKIENYKTMYSNCDWAKDKRSSIRCGLANAECRLRLPPVGSECKIQSSLTSF
jgi:hypothetical protein